MKKILLSEINERIQNSDDFILFSVKNDRMTVFANSQDMSLYMIADFLIQNPRFYAEVNDIIGIHRASLN